MPNTAYGPVLEDLRVNLIVARAKARLSQEDLAARSGVGRIDFSFGGATTDEILTTIERFRDEVLARV